MLDTKDLKALKDNSYIKGNSDAKITRIEYSDLECPYCAKLHNA
jgi:protein-disulfide isomerase